MDKKEENELYCDYPMKYRIGMSIETGNYNTYYGIMIIERRQASGDTPSFHIH